MKIYTGTGDKGKTGLFSGERVPKSDVRLDAYGDLDELNAFIGALIASLTGKVQRLAPELRQIQADLFAVGAWMATTPGSAAVDSLTPLTPDMALRLERAIDRMDAGLKPLRQFILPGGHPSAAWAHIARTVCRRAERGLVRLMEAIPHETPETNYRCALVYLNRLSDYFFLLARTCNRIHDVDDSPWSG